MHIWQNNIFILLVFIAAGIVAVVARALFQRNKDQNTPSQLTHINQMEKETSLPQAAIIALNPLHGISFEESLKPATLSIQIEENIAKALLKSYGAEAANTALQVKSILKGGWLVVFDNEQYEFMKTADGTYKAVTRAANGTIKEIGNIDLFGTWLNKLSHVSSLVNSVSHMISNADLSRRLSEVQSNTDNLLEYRQIDTNVEMRTSYEALREELNKEKPQPIALASHREKFRSCRHRLFGEARHDIADLRPLLKFKRERLQKTEQWMKRRLTHRFDEREQAIDDVMSKLQLAAYCLQMENIIASYSGVEDDQRLLLAEAEKEWAALASELDPLEKELAADCYRTGYLREVARVWHLES